MDAPRNQREKGGTCYFYFFLISKQKWKRCTCVKGQRYCACAPLDPAARDATTAGGTTNAPAGGGRSSDGSLLSSSGHLSSKAPA